MVALDLTIVTVALPRIQARALGAQLASVHIDLAVGTRFQRTQETIGQFALGPVGGALRGLFQGCPSTDAPPRERLPDGRAPITSGN